MVNRDDREWWSGLEAINGHRGAIECGRHGVDGDRGEGGCGILLVWSQYMT